MTSQRLGLIDHRSSSSNLFSRERLHRHGDPVNLYKRDGSINFDDPRAEYFHHQEIRDVGNYYRAYNRAGIYARQGRIAPPVFGQRLGTYSPTPDIAYLAKQKADRARAAAAAPKPLFERVEDPQTPAAEVDEWALTPGRRLMPGTFGMPLKRKVQLEIDFPEEMHPAKRLCETLITGPAGVVAGDFKTVVNITAYAVTHYGPPAARAACQGAKTGAERGVEAVKNGAIAAGQGAVVAGIASGHAAIGATVWSGQQMVKPAYAVVRQYQAATRRGRQYRRNRRGPNATMVPDQLQRVINIHEKYEEQPFPVKFRQTMSLVTAEENGKEPEESFVEVYTDELIEREKIKRLREEAAREKERESDLLKWMKEKFVQEGIDWNTIRRTPLTSPQAKFIMRRAIHRRKQEGRKRNFTRANHINPRTKITTTNKPQQVNDNATDTNLDSSPSRTAHHQPSHHATELSKLTKWLIASIDNPEPESPAAANGQNPSHPTANSQNIAQPAQTASQPIEGNFYTTSLQGSDDEGSDCDSLFEGSVSAHSFDSLFDEDETEAAAQDASQSTQPPSSDPAAGQQTDDTELSSVFVVNELPDFPWGADAEYDPYPLRSDPEMSRHPTDAKRRQHKKQMRRNMKPAKILSPTDPWPLDFIDYDESEHREWSWPSEINGEFIPYRTLHTPEPYLSDPPATQLKSDFRRAARPDSDDSSDVSSTIDPTWVIPPAAHAPATTKKPLPTPITTPDAKGKAIEKTPSPTAEPTAAPSTGHNAEGSSTTPVSAKSSDENATLRTPTSRSPSFRRRLYAIGRSTPASTVSTPASAISSTYDLSPGPTPRLEDQQEHIGPQAESPVSQPSAPQTPNVETRSAAHARKALKDEPEVAIADPQTPKVAVADPTADKTAIAEPQTPKAASSTTPAGPAPIPSPFKRTVTILQQDLDVQCDPSKISTPKGRHHLNAKTTRVTRKQALLQRKIVEAQLYNIIPLTVAQRAIFQEAKRKGTKDIKASSFMRIATLPGGFGTDAWLDDEAVNEYMKLNVEEGRASEQPGTTIPSHHAFNSFFYGNLAQGNNVDRWARRAKIGGSSLLYVKYVFIPINSGGHWTLAVVEGTARKIVYYDSLGGSGREKLKIIRAWVEKELGAAYVAEEWEEVVGWSARQGNADDCGVFTVTNAKNLVLKGRTEGFDAGVQRERMVVEIFGGRLLRVEGGKGVEEEEEE